MIKKFEYKVVGDIIIPMTLSVLNEYGDEGWELVYLKPYKENQLEAIFKRIKEDLPVNDPKPSDEDIENASCEYTEQLNGDGIDTAVLVLSAYQAGAKADRDGKINIENK